MSENNKYNQKRLPVLPLLEKPLFPETFTTLMLGRPEDVQTMNTIISSDGYFVALYQNKGNPPKFSAVGTLSKVSKFIRLPNNCLHVFISTIKRVKALSFDIAEKAIYAEVEDFDDTISNERTIEPYTRVLKETASSLSQNSAIFSFATDINISNIDDPSLLSFYTAAALASAKGPFLQDILETRSPRSRIEKILSFISAEKEVLDKENIIRNEIFSNIKNRNKEIVLREQIRVLTQELNQITGQQNPQSQSVPMGLMKAGDLYQRAKEKQLPPKYREVVDKELEKLGSLETMNPEYMLTKQYIENIIALPFSFTDSADSYSIHKVKEQLEKDHYGMKEVKERILEFLASRLKAQTSKGAIICLAGPPGVGKTSVGHSIAASLGRKFFRFSVGGMRDESEIKGHRRTYVGAMPGKIIQGMKTTGVVNPVFLIDEIDKMGESIHGDPASALLEVLDPEQNTNYQDFYIDLPYDLSKVLFIVTANDVSRIPEPLLDRMEIIELSGYTPNEKLKIGIDYLVPRLLKKNGLDKKEIRFSKKALSIIAEQYAREAGVRNFEKLIDKVMRKVALSILQDEENLKLPINIKQKDVEKYLGKPIFPLDDIVKADKPGTALGLAWTSMGGDVLLIEAESLPFKGDLKVTGQLGDVMKESVSIAWSTLRKEAYERGLELDFFESNSVHLHIPEGAVPKDGPSAGITLFTALWSMLRDTPAIDGLAMTGELTLTGKVMPIGGLKEKILAARRNSVRTIIIPEKNKRDLDKLDDEVKGDVCFHLVKDISEVMEIAFPHESAKRLTKEELSALNKERKEKEAKAKDEETLSKAKAFERILNWQ